MLFLMAVSVTADIFGLVLLVYAAKLLVVMAMDSPQEQPDGFKFAIMKVPHN